MIVYLALASPWGRLEEERMDPGILDHSFEQLAAERTFSLFLLYSNLGWSITISEHINAQDCRVDM